MVQITEHACHALTVASPLPQGISSRCPVTDWPPAPLSFPRPSTEELARWASPSPACYRRDQGKNETVTALLEQQTFLCWDNPERTTGPRRAKDTGWWRSWGGRTTWWALPRRQRGLDTTLQGLRGETAVSLLRAKVFIFLNKVRHTHTDHDRDSSVGLDHTPLYWSWFQATSASRIITSFS